MSALDALRAIAAHMEDGEDAPLATLAVAVPHYSVRVTAICVERRNMGVLSEYIMRAIACGFHVPSDIADFLGVPVDEVKSELTLLFDAFCVVADSTAGRVELMEKGRAAVSKEGLRTAVVKEVTCLMNGVTRRILFSVPDLAPRKRLPQGTLALPAIPARPPRVGELDLPGVKGAMTASMNPAYRFLEISRLGRVVRTTNLFQTGHVILRRGSHSVPTFCVNGSADAQLSHLLGAHPALQSLKHQLERHEKQVRHHLVTKKPKMRGQGTANAAAFRNAVSSLDSWRLAVDEVSAAFQKQFCESVMQLLEQPHWISGDECRVLLQYATLTSKKRLLIGAPSASGLMDTEIIDQMAVVAARGVNVELHVAQEDLLDIENDPDVRSALRMVKVVPMNQVSEWCGFSWDSSFAVIGSRKSMTNSMGRTQAFFGCVLINDPQSESLLREVALSGVPVKIKRVLPIRGGSDERA